MLEHIIRYTYSERAFNEDVCAADASFMFVIDGATGLGENDVMGTGDDEGQYRTADPQRGPAAFPDCAGSGQRSTQSICLGY